jgi:capsular exopolysaccharide synthesis family protein
MSTFFKALERAEQERALRNPKPAPAAEPAPSAAQASPAPVVPIAPVAPVPPIASVPPIAPVAPVVPIGTPQRSAHSVFRNPREMPIPVPVPELPATGLEEHLVSFLDPMSFEAEQYRALRHLVEQLHRSADLSVIAVSSADANDGKTTTTINLAGALSQALDSSVLLVDADLRGSTLAGHLGLDENAPGLVDAILDPNLPLEAVARPHPNLHLSVLPAGRRSSTPYEVLKSARVGELLAEARRKYDYVIVDTPPLVSVPDTRVVAKWMDGFLLVVAANRTPRKLVTEALNVVDRSKVIGFVFNGDNRHPTKDSYASRRYSDHGRLTRASELGREKLTTIARWSRWSAGPNGRRKG